MVDIRQSQQWANYLTLLGWHIETINSVYIAIKPLGFWGSVIKINRAPILPEITALEKLAQKYKAWQITLEPDLCFPLQDLNKLTSLGFVMDRWPLSPSKTIFINLKQTPEELLAQMKPKTRYNLKLAQRNKLTVKVTRNLTAFKKLWLANMRRKGYFWLSTTNLEACHDAFGPQSQIVLVSHLNEPVAGVMVILSTSSAHYMFAASSQKGNKLFAPTLAAWQAIQLAQDFGSSIFDFEGVYDKRFHRATYRWQGFTRFKAGFGGQEVIYPPVYTKFRLPFLKLINKLPI